MPVSVKELFAGAAKLRGSILASHPVALGFLLGIHDHFFYVAKIYHWGRLEGSRQRLRHVDQTHQAITTKKLLASF